MKYMGSKNRIAKDILPAMLRWSYPGQCWVEPFTGGGNMIDKVPLVRLGGDSSLFAVSALRLIRDNPESIPEIITEDMYHGARQRIKDRDYSQIQLDSWTGFAMSYGAKWWGGYSRGRNRRGQQRNYALEGRKNALNQSPGLQGVHLTCMSYHDLWIPDCSIIYCDPPYRHTIEYGANKEAFDHDMFWEWCRQSSSENHTVFISEYTAPDDFECIWSKEIVSGIVKGKRNIEKLFISGRK